MQTQRPAVYTQKKQLQAINILGCIGWTNTHTHTHNEHIKVISISSTCLVNANTHISVRIHKAHPLHTQCEIMMHAGTSLSFHCSNPAAEFFFTTGFLQKNQLFAALNDSMGGLSSSLLGATGQVVLSYMQIKIRFF